MDKCAISVLLPVFRPNMEFLKLAVDSVINQTFGDFELIFLYEPSSGDEAVVVYFDELQKTDSRVKVVEFASKTGLPKSLNRGIEVAQGRYIARMDADDYSYQDRFEKQYAYMEKHPETVLYGSPIRIMGTDRVVFGNNYTDKDIHGIRMLFSNAGVPHPTAFLRRDFLMQHNLRYNEEIRGSEDYRLWGDIIREGGCIDMSDEPMLDYRMYEEQASKRLADQMVSWDNQVRSLQLERYGLNDEKYQKLLFAWAEDSLAGSVRENFEFFCALLRENRNRDLYRDDLFKKELAYQWSYKALLWAKNRKEFGFVKYFWKLVPISTWSYAIRNIKWVVKEWKN